MDVAAIGLAATSSTPALLLCSEHASQRLPPDWDWPDADVRLVDTHWAYDIGAEVLVRELCAAMGAGAVMSRFTRLLIDPNRPLTSPTIIRRRADGRAVELNATLSTDERQRREHYWHGYHNALGQAAQQSSAAVMMAVHTFTDDYEGQRRDHIEVGVLFDAEEELAHRVRDAIASAGMAVKLNEPYSGKEGLIYSVERHARATGKRAIEIEVRQDLAVDPGFRAALVEVLMRVAWPR